MTAKALRTVNREELCREIHNSVQTTFSGMFSLKPHPEAEFVKTECIATGDVSGIVKLVQAQDEGAMIVCFPRETIFGILSRLYRKEFKEIDKSVLAGVGEITNIVFGVVKANLNKNGLSLKMQIPSVALSENYKGQINTPHSTLVVPFNTDVGPISVLWMTRAEVEAEKAAAS